jgi:hypothetical protein
MNKRRRLQSLIFPMSLFFMLAVNAQTSITLGQGQMPSIANDQSGNLHVVYGKNDSIMYVSSRDGGITFSQPSLVTLLPHLAAFASRGPQVTVSPRGISVLACSQEGDIYSYFKATNRSWTRAVKVNDRDTIAKENLTALSGDGDNAFAVWLDLRSGHNQLYGAHSVDGGKSWSKNQLIYASPDKTICECCKPSVVVNGKSVHVMYRNWLNGNRDLYLMQSVDAGKSFGKPVKLGVGSWQLNGCPMDGGGLAVKNDNTVETVWRRQGKIFTCEPGQPEHAIGDGKSCGITMTKDGAAYTWVEDGKIVCLLPKTGRRVIGEGLYPVTRLAGKDKIVCVWENKKTIQLATLTL